MPIRKMTIEERKAWLGGGIVMPRPKLGQGPCEDLKTCKPSSANRTNSDNLKPKANDKE